MDAKHFNYSISSFQVINLKLQESFWFGILLSECTQGGKRISKKF